MVWELGGLQTAIRCTLVATDQLQLAEAKQERQMICVVLGALGSNLLALLVHGGEFERLEVMA